MTLVRRRPQVRWLTTALLLVSCGDAPSTPRERLAGLGIALDLVPANHGRVTGVSPEAGVVSACLDVIADELLRYPADLFELGVVRRISLLANLAVDDEAAAGTIDPTGGTLFLDAIIGERHPEHLKRTLHHELFHLIDYADDGVIDRDPEWDALNDPDLPYLPGLRSFEVMQGAAEPSERYPGYISLYARTSLAEDKAELFEFAMMDPEYVARRGDEDPHVRRKLALLRERIRSFCPAMDADWWAP